MDHVKIKYEMISVDELNFDLKNPRIAQWLEMYGDNVDDNAMKLALQRGGSDNRAAGPSYRSLQESIRTNGGVLVTLKFAPALRLRPSQLLTQL